VISQRQWDEQIALGFVRGHQNTAKLLLSAVHSSEVSPSDVPEVCADHGLLRIPRIVAAHRDRWYFMFSKLPVSAWLVRAMPGSLNLFMTGDEHHLRPIPAEEIVALLEAHGRFKKLHPRRLATYGKKQRLYRRAVNTGGGGGIGVPQEIHFRSRDKSSNWKTVK